MKQAIAYYRVSTDKQGKSGLGLEAQQFTVERYCNQSDYDLITCIIEVQSTRKYRAGLFEAITTTPYFPTKIFISHASSDSHLVEEVIDLLENIGLSSSQIFCSSIEGYGIKLGDNFLEAIKKEIDESVLVLFILGNNFYSSPVCLCEMGAVWVKSVQHIPILIPPFDFLDIKGVIPLTQGFKINDPKKWNLFKSKIEVDFQLTSLDLSAWERKRDKAIRVIERIINLS
ncbi:TIR domain-containing protein [Mucilaginibacter polytrichastri]|uniref:TIR domain-containing protein n=1 Tax=Mucilaginibacter polytrichastri TaxID=1302689 RepID=UPI0011153509|nr:TIR domain-containing protein [Mucilaginibacter polytrichastri]